MVWPFTKKKVLDLTGKNFAAKTTKISEQEYADLTQNPLGFLGNMAESVSSASSGDLKQEHFKVKIEDFEYKLDSLSRKISSLIDRIDLVEKKVDRNERRGM